MRCHPPNDACDLLEMRATVAIPLGRDFLPRANVLIYVTAQSYRAGVLIPRAHRSKSLFGSSPGQGTGPTGKRPFSQNLQAACSHAALRASFQTLRACFKIRSRGRESALISQETCEKCAD